jgi:hypothetical protein
MVGEVYKSFDGRYCLNKGNATKIGRYWYARPTIFKGIIFELEGNYLPTISMDR